MDLPKQRSLSTFVKQCKPYGDSASVMQFWLKACLEHLRINIQGPKVTCMELGGMKRGAVVVEQSRCKPGRVCSD